MSNLKYKLEALLFSSARSMTIEELSNLTKASPEEIREKIQELKKDYEEKDSSITLIDEGNSFRLNVKPEHTDVINQIVTETELSKTLMETLAVIAFKYPIKQSDLIKIRTNKSYDHLRELEEIGYIVRQKFGRTKLIKLTPKFFEYFDLPPEKLKEKFANFEGIATAIKSKEDEIKQIKEEMKKKAEEAGKKEKKEGEPEIDLIDEVGHKEKLDVYKETKEEVEQEESKEVQPYTDHVGNLEVTDVPEEEEPEETEQVEPGDTELLAQMGENVVDEIRKMVKEEEKGKQKPSKDTENEVDDSVEKLLNPKEDEEPEQSEETEEGSSEEPEDQAEETSEEPKEEEPEEEKDLLEESTEEKQEQSEEEPKDLLDTEEAKEKKKE